MRKAPKRGRSSQVLIHRAEPKFMTFPFARVAYLKKPESKSSRSRRSLFVSHRHRRWLSNQELPGLFRRVPQTSRNRADGRRYRLGVRHGEPIVAPDIINDERFQGKAQLAYGFRASAMLPLNVQNDVHGVMQLSSKQPGHFDGGHKDQLMAIARQMGIALENRRLFSDLKSSRDDLEKANEALIETNRMLTVLRALASASSQSLNLDQILRAAIEQIVEIFTSMRCAFIFSTSPEIGSPCAHPSSMTRSTSLRRAPSSQGKALSELWPNPAKK